MHEIEKLWERYNELQKQFWKVNNNPSLDISILDNMSDVEEALLLFDPNATEDLFEETHKRNQLEYERNKVT